MYTVCYNAKNLLLETLTCSNDQVNQMDVAQPGLMQYFTYSTILNSLSSSRGHAEPLYQFCFKSWIEQCTENFAVRVE